MLLSGVGGVACLAGGIVLMLYGHFALASFVGAFPMIFLLGMMIWGSVRQGAASAERHRTSPIPNWSVARTTLPVGSKWISSMNRPCVYGASTS